MPMSAMGWKAAVGHGSQQELRSWKALMNQAEQTLSAILGPVLREHGFKRVASGLAFTRRTSFGFHYLSLPSFATGAGGPYVVNVGLGVRHGQIDDIVNRLGHIWGEANQKNTTTVYRGLEHFPFEPTRDGRKVIRSERLEADAHFVASDVLAMFQLDGLEFFRRYSDVYECSVGLNDPIEARTHSLCNNFQLRTCYGVAAAALTQPERVASLVRDYTDFARREGVSDTPVFDVGKELSGADALKMRLEYVAEASRSLSTL